MSDKVKWRDAKSLRDRIEELQRELDEKNRVLTAIGELLDCPCGGAARQLIKPDPDTPEERQ